MQQLPEGDFDISDRLAFRINTLASTISIWAGRTYLDKCGVTMSEWRVLVMLVTLGPSSARQICDVSKMDKGNVSRAVKKLLRDGRVTEKPDPKDGRASILRITPKGRSAYKKVKAYSDQREAALSKALTAEERRIYCEVSDKLQAVGEELISELGREENKV